MMLLIFSVLSVPPVVYTSVFRKPLNFANPFSILMNGDQQRTAVQEVTPACLL